MITPSTATQIEYEPFTITFTVEPIDPLNPPTIESVSVSASDGKDYSSELTITISGLSVNVSGTLSDIFNRTISYLDEQHKHGEVARFKDLPPKFSTIYKFVGATQASTSLTVGVVTSQGIETATITINNNHSVANSNLVKYVDMGKF